MEESQGFKISLNESPEQNQLDDILSFDGKIKNFKQVVEWINGLVEEATKNPGRAWWGGSKSASKGMAGIKNACKELGWENLAKKLNTNQPSLRDVIALEVLLNRIENAAALTKRGRTKTYEFISSLDESRKVCTKELQSMQTKLDVLNKDAGLKNVIKLQNRVRGFLQRKKGAKLKDIENETNTIQSKITDTINDNEDLSALKKEELIERNSNIINGELDQ